MVRRNRQRRKKVKERDFWEEMPRDDLYPGDEKYELEDKKEDIGKVTISPVKAHFEGLGVTNEAVRYEDVGISTYTSQSEEMGISDNAVNCDGIGIWNEAMQ